MEKKESNNWGCIIVVILYIIGNIIYFVNHTSEADIAAFGGSILFFVGIGVGYYILSKSSSSDNTIREEKVHEEKNHKEKDNEEVKSESSVKGCLVPIGVSIFILLMGGIFSSSTSMNYTVGIIASIVLAVVIGLLAYKSMND